jgi:(p)ppGpp synthase/HD superfamily hydrolase
MLQRAINIATKAHAEHRNKFNGEPYLLHVFRVITNTQDILKKFKVADDADPYLTVAALHDTVEDTDVTLNDIWTAFDDEIAEAVDAVTHRDDEPYSKYIARIIEGGFLPAVVKLADLTDHLARPEPRPGMHQKYQAAYDRILIFLTTGAKHEQSRSN